MHRIELGMDLTLSSLLLAGLCCCNREGMSRKEYLKAKCLELMFGWECSPGWYQFARLLELFIMDAFVDMFITLCIVVNTAFMAMDHAGMSEDLANVLSIGNYVSRLCVLVKLKTTSDLDVVCCSC